MVIVVLFCRCSLSLPRTLLPRTDIAAPATQTRLLNWQILLGRANVARAVTGTVRRTQVHTRFILCAFFIGLTAVAAAEPEVNTQLQALNTSGEIVSQGADGDYYDLLQMVARKGVGENSAWADRIYTLLHKHYRSQATDPPHIRQDIEIMANYFSRYSDLYPLFTALEKMPWRWQYNSGKAETQVQGTRLQVRHANILFDSRAGARFQFQKACRNKIAHCFAAPVDVFLHELLHVQTIFSKPQEFIAQGGMSLHLYPHDHEQHTIGREQQLFRTMTQRDFIPRPRRSSHAGQRTITHCVTCLQ